LFARQGRGGVSDEVLHVLMVALALVLLALIFVTRSLE